MDEKAKQLSKLLLKLEWVLGYISSITLLVCVFVASFVEMPVYGRVILIVFGIISFILGMYFCLVIEQKAGYYECKHCKHKHIPNFSQVLWSPHYGRTRYMRCPKCNKKSWQHKTLEEKINEN